MRIHGVHLTPHIADDEPRAPTSRHEISLARPALTHPSSLPPNEGLSDEQLSGERTTAHTRSESTTEVLGLHFRDEPLHEVADSLISEALDGIPHQVFFVNAHCVNLAARDGHYRALLRNENALYADGMGLAIAARISGTCLRYNVNGTDLFPILCEKAAAKSVPIALLGARPGVALSCAERMKRTYPGLNVAWVSHGFHPAAEEETLIDELNGSGARILLVAKGVPIQEAWISQNAPRLQIPVLMGVGALFDFYSGAVPRSPAILRRIGMEWFFRFLIEPRRLFRRYIIGNPEFLMRAILYRLTGGL